MMRKLISCAYHEDSQTVELLYTDGTLIDITAWPSKTRSPGTCTSGQSWTACSPMTR